MKRSLLAALLFFGLSCFAAAAEKFPPPAGRVNDFAGVMEPADVQRLESVLAELERKTGAELAVVTVQSVPDGDIERAAVDLFAQWGIGKKGKDNGLLILCAVRDRQVRIEVGYGLEPILPDAKAGRIIRERMLPHFRAGRLSAGLLSAGLAAAAEVARSYGAALTDSGVVPSVPDERQFSDFEVLLILLLVAGLLAALAYAARRQKKGTRGKSSGGSWGSDSGGGGGFGGFGGGTSGGGGASGRW